MRLEAAYSPKPLSAVLTLVLLICGVDRYLVCVEKIPRLESLWALGTGVILFVVDRLDVVPQDGLPHEPLFTPAGRVV